MDFQRIPTIDNLEVFHHITDLYLQHVRVPPAQRKSCSERNCCSEPFSLVGAGMAVCLCVSSGRADGGAVQNRIRVLENLECLAHLKFLALAHNQIEKVRITFT